MAIRNLTLVGLVFLLTACGGGGSSVAPSPGGSTVLVTAYGDSTQYAHGQPHASSRLEFKVNNRGAGGSNTQELLQGTDGVNPPWSVQMQRDTARIVVINHGINDRRYPLDTYRSNLRALAETAQLAGKIVMFEEPNPVAETPTPRMIEIDFDIAEFEARRTAMRSLASSMGLYFCAQPRVELADGIHPTPAGYTIKADRLAVCIADLIG